MSRSTSRALSALAAAAALTACSNTGDRAAGDSRICTPFPEAAAANNGQAAAVQPPADPAAAVDDCLHRWAYTLAASSDRAEEVAQASVSACTGAVSHWNQQGLATAGGPGATPAEAPSLVTGQASNPMAEHYGYAQARALFYVVQARAGKCAAPATRPAQATR